MAWRDRTNLFISYRQSYAHHPSKKAAHSSSNAFHDRAGSPALPVSDERRGLMSAGAYDEPDGGDVVIEMDLLPPRWLDVQDEVTEALASIAEDTRRLEQLHAKHVLPGFDDEDVKKREEREIERFTQVVTRKFQQCQKAIKRIDGLVQGRGENRAEETMARNLKISLATKVGDVSAVFRKKQSNYLKKLRSLGGLSSPALGASSTANPFADPSLLDSETDRSLSQSTLQQTAQHKLLHVDDNEAMIAQREREIEALAKGIIDLANIFQELQHMVIDQGSMLDRIDYNVERMAEDVKGADQELTVATGYQRRSLKRKIMLLLLLIIAGMIILLGLKLGSKSSAPASPPPAENAPVVDDPSTRLISRRIVRLDAAQGFSEVTKRHRRRKRRRHFVDMIIE